MQVSISLFLLLVKSCIKYCIDDDIVFYLDLSAKFNSGSHFLFDQDLRIHVYSQKDRYNYQASAALCMTVCIASCGTSLVIFFFCNQFTSSDEESNETDLTPIYKFIEKSSLKSKDQ